MAKLKATKSKGQKKLDQSGQKEQKTKTSLKTTKRKKAQLRLTRGRVYIQATYNNTIVTVTDINGNIISWSTAGVLEFKGAKKATPYAAQKVVEDAINKVRKTGLSQVDVFARGIGSGRDSAIRALGAQGLDVLSIKDVTPMPHNGCRPRKVRRV